MQPWNTPAGLRLIELALEEDLSGGDVTSRSVIGPGVRARAAIVARQELVLAGLAVAELIFDRVDPGVRFAARARDGQATARGEVLAEVTGPASGILAAERTALNFLQHMSGVATLTRRFVDAAGPGGARIADTRKTTPGYRALEKYSVRQGGGINHRTDLASGILIKDNHVVVAGSVGEAIRRARVGAPPGLKVEIEVDTLEQLQEVLDVGCDVVMLDNFTLQDTVRAVAMARAKSPETLLEASGGVNLETVGAIARTGVDFISVGALTHSAPAADIALDLQIEPGGPV